MAKWIVFQTKQLLNQLSDTVVLFEFSCTPVFPRLCSICSLNFASCDVNLQDVVLHMSDLNFISMVFGLEEGGWD